jgi:hypothetical protein
MVKLSFFGQCGVFWQMWHKIVMVLGKATIEQCVLANAFRFKHDCPDQLRWFFISLIYTKTCFPGSYIWGCCRYLSCYRPWIVGMGVGAGGGGGVDYSKRYGKSKFHLAKVLNLLGKLYLVMFSNFFVLRSSDYRHVLYVKCDLITSADALCKCVVVTADEVIKKKSWCSQCKYQHGWSKLTT